MSGSIKSYGEKKIKQSRGAQNVKNARNVLSRVVNEGCCFFSDFHHLPIHTNSFSAHFCFALYL